MKDNQLCMNLHHYALWVDDVDEAMARYALLLGLHGEKTGDSAIMRCMHEDFSLVLKPAGGGQKAELNYVAYELIPGLSLTEASDVLKTRGESAKQIDVPVRGKGLLLNDSDGNRIVLIERQPPEDRRPPIMIETKTLGGFHPRKFDHINYITDDIQGAFKWYTEVLGFQLTDWIGDEAFWLHINGQHHVIAFLDTGQKHIHHMAYSYVDFGEIRQTLDHISKHGKYVTWGPLRHGMAQNLAVYWRMEEEDMFIELCTDMQQLEADHEPVVHPDNPYSSNTWGILPPRSYFKFDKESIEKERENVHTQIHV
ncbi:MAG: VOC family protein [Anaerolineae bacterium]